MFFSSYFSNGYIIVESSISIQYINILFLVLLGISNSFAHLKNTFKDHFLLLI